MSLFDDFMTHRGDPIHKWSHYFPIYEKHFASWKNRSLFFLEIGVFKGGSVQMWQRYFGPYAKIVGIDVNPDCKQYEKPGIAIRIGNQTDTEFLQSIIDEFGVPDVVLDDGGHAMWHVNPTFDFLYPKMGKNAVYLIEDMHTAYWPKYGGGVDNPETFINRSKNFIDQLNARHSKGTVEETEITRDTLCISYYDSIVVLEKGDLHWREMVTSGGEGS